MIAVLGEALWDVFPAEIGQSVRARRTEVRHPGGAPANVARILAKLGVPTSFIGTLGDDPLGDGLLDVLVADGVDVSHVSRVRARTGITFVDPRPDGTCAFVPYREGGADFLLTTERVGEVKAKLLHLGSSSFSRSPSREAAFQAMVQVPRVSLDLNVYKHLWKEPILPALGPLLGGVDLLKASADDLRALGLDAAALHALRPDKLTIVTQGPAGAIAFEGKNKLEIPARATTIVDATGAGDAFVAGVLSVLHERDDLRGALERGADLAARAVAEVGATTWLR
ncbi:MAG: carbohydrate kinase family protein [Polyangiales bacterium]